MDALGAIPEETAPRSAAAAEWAQRGANNDEDDRAIGGRGGGGVGFVNVREAEEPCFVDAIYAKK